MNPESKINILSKTCFIIALPVFAGSILISIENINLINFVIELVIVGFALRRYKTFLIKSEIAAITSFIISLGLILGLMTIILLIMSPVYFDFVYSLLRNQFSSFLVLTAPWILTLALTTWLLLILELITRTPELEQRLNDLFLRKLSTPILNSFLFVYSPLEYIRKFFRLNIAKFWSYKGGIIIGLILSCILMPYMKSSFSTLSAPQLMAVKLAEKKYGHIYHYYIYYVSRNKNYAEAYAYNKNEVKKIKINLNQ